MFEYAHRVQFYETDLMRILHHANYLRIFEEARVAWAHEKGLLPYSDPEKASAFAVVETRVRHVAPGVFGDLLKVQLQAKRQGVRIVFEYKMWKDKILVAEARTEHVSLDPKLRLQRPGLDVKTALEGEAWNETWLSNL